MAFSDVIAQCTNITSSMKLRSRKLCVVGHFFCCTILQVAHCGQEKQSIVIVIIVVNVYSKTSISINKYMQKAGEPENDAGFPKVIIIAAVHVAS